MNNLFSEEKKADNDLFSVDGSDSVLSAYIDHTLLAPTATREQVIKLCSEANDMHFASVCVNSKHCALAVASVNPPIKVCCVVGFPLGASLSTVKATEAVECIKLGAQEIDMVIDIGAAKEKDFEAVKNDIALVVAAVSKATTEYNLSPCIVKCIIETALLDEEEKRKCCIAASQAGANYVKTSTGFSTSGATSLDVANMRKWAALPVKASGGIRTLSQAQEMIKAGASRLGCSASVSIIESFKNKDI